MHKSGMKRFHDFRLWFMAHYPSGHMTLTAHGWYLSDFYITLFFDDDETSVRLNVDHKYVYGYYNHMSGKLRFLAQAEETVSVIPHVYAHFDGYLELGIVEAYKNKLRNQAQNG